MCTDEMKLLLSGHIDGTNTAQQEEVLQKHLARCASCRSTLQDYERNDAMLRSCKKEAPKDFTASVMEAICVETPKPKTSRQFPFRYATAIAAVAAVFLIVVSTGKLSFSDTGSTAVYSSTQPHTEQEETAIALPKASLSAAENQSSDTVHANVDCAALAEAEGIPVGVLYAEKAPEIAENAPVLRLSGAARYTITQAQLEALQGENSDLILYTPKAYTPDETASAYLIVVESK